MLRPRPVEAAFAGRAFALDGLAVLVNRRENLVLELVAPAFGRAHDPLHLMVAADLDQGRLVAGRNDDRVVGRVIVDRIDVRPVAACAGTNNVAELIVLVLFGKLLGRHRLPGLRSIDVEAHGTLVERLENNVAIRIEDVEETPFVDDDAVFIHFNDHVADRAHVLAVGTLDVGRGHANEIVAVLHRIHCVREVVVAVRQAVIPDFAAHQVVLDVALAVAPGEGAVLVLTEAHHDAGFVDIVEVEDRIRIHIPADLALRVDDRVLRIAVPFERAAHGVVPNSAG